jgi:hypothetical protein
LLINNWNAGEIRNRGWQQQGQKICLTWQDVKWLNMRKIQATQTRSRTSGITLTLIALLHLIPILQMKAIKRNGPIQCSTNRKAVHQ